MNLRRFLAIGAPLLALGALGAPPAQAGSGLLDGLLGPPPATAPPTTAAIAPPVTATAAAVSVPKAAGPQSGAVAKPGAPVGKKPHFVFKAKVGSKVTRAKVAGPWSLAGQPCRLLPVPAVRASSPVGVAESCPGVRPGAAVLIPQDAATFLCTLNFMWKGSDGATYMGTAGHCILEGTTVVEASWAPGGGPEVRDSTGRRIGDFAYAVLDDPADFALIRLDPAAAAGASPQACHFGGPTGVDNDPIDLLQPLAHVGQGTIVSAALPARTDLALNSDVNATEAIGVASGGDSGSPVFSSDGRAVGVLVAVAPALPVEPVAIGAVVFSTRVGPQMARAARFTQTDYTLQTAPVL